MKHAKDGFILVAMIWIIAILTVLTLGFAHRALVDERAAALSLDHAEAQYRARGAVNYAISDIQNKAFVDGLADQARGQVPQNSRGGSQGPVVKPTNDAPNLLTKDGVFTVTADEVANEVSFSVVDAEGRISANTAPEDVLDEIDGLGMRAISGIMRRRGTELSPEDREPFIAIEELRQLEDMDDDAWQGNGDTPGLRDLFTVYGDGRINVNTASRAVLAAVPDIDDDVVDRIIAYRSGDDGMLGTGDDRQFRSLDTMSSQLSIDPTSLAPLARYCTFQSHFFTITGFATRRQGKVRAASQAVIHVYKGGASVLSWSEGEFGPQVAH